MTLLFHKMHGLGNDFMVLDSTQANIQLTPDRVRQLADRRTGVGFDQMLRLRDRSDGDLDVEIINADGSPAEQCGNGMRAIAQLLHRQDQNRLPCLLHTAGGILRLSLGDHANTFSVDFPAPNILPMLHALKLEGNECIECAQPVLVGNPHLVIDCDDPQSYREQYGQSLSSLKLPGLEQYREGLFANGCNAGFARIDGTHIDLCVWERGAGPTQACGSGACAAAWVVMHKQGLRQVSVDQPGGRLMLEWVSEMQIRMTGEAVYIYQGKIDWPIDSD